ncbi:hypothetical protein AGLY_016259 [Aphis glycines]|uniref:Uncharacterized protein n=1 Tax=Aphis glycines TaxID=307491 RepID=A0A6G0T054_APHGL|nr:hypothetical protein AGLY_016259 [Aphis glycines]
MYHRYNVSDVWSLNNLKTLLPYSFSGFSRNLGAIIGKYTKRLVVHISQWHHPKAKTHFILTEQRFETLEKRCIYIKISLIYDIVYITFKENIIKGVSLMHLMNSYLVIWRNEELRVRLCNSNIFIQLESCCLILKQSKTLKLKLCITRSILRVKNLKKSKSSLNLHWFIKTYSDIQFLTLFSTVLAMKYLNRFVLLNERKETKMYNIVAVLKTLLLIIKEKHNDTKNMSLNDSLCLIFSGKNNLNTFGIARRIQNKVEDATTKINK